MYLLVLIKLVCVFVIGVLKIFSKSRLLPRKLVVTQKQCFCKAWTSGGCQHGNICIRFCSVHINSVHRGPWCNKRNAY